MGLIHDPLRTLERLQVAQRPGAAVATGDFSATNTVVARCQVPARLRVDGSVAAILGRVVRALCPQLHPCAELNVGPVVVPLAISTALLTVRIDGEDMRLGLAHEQKRAHMCSRREAATDQLEVMDVIPLTRVKVAADCWPLLSPPASCPAFSANINLSPSGPLP